MVEALRPDDDMGFASSDDESTESISPEEDMGFVSFEEEGELELEESNTGKTNYYWGEPPELEEFEEIEYKGPSLLSRMDMRGRFGLWVSAFLYFLMMFLVIRSPENPEGLLYVIVPTLLLFLLAGFYILMIVVFGSIVCLRDVLVGFLWDLPIMMVQLPFDLFFSKRNRR